MTANDWLNETAVGVGWIAVGSLAVAWVLWCVAALLRAGLWLVGIAVGVALALVGMGSTLGHWIETGSDTMRWWQVALFGAGVALAVVCGLSRMDEFTGDE